MTPAYDLAGQLTAAPSDSGSTFKAYISGTPKAGDAVSVTAYDAALTGTTPPGQETASYSVQSGDTSATIASNLASNIATTMSNIGVTASASGPVITITTSASKATQFTSAVSGTAATDTISLSGASANGNLHKQLYYSYDCAGNRIGVQGDSSGSFPSGLTTTATQYAYNNLNELTAISPGGPIRFAGTTVNPVKAAVVDVTQTITVGGTITPGDIPWLSVYDKSLNQGEALKYTVNSGDTTSTIAAAIAAAVAT